MFGRPYNATELFSFQYQSIMMPVELSFLYHFLEIESWLARSLVWAFWELLNRFHSYCSKSQRNYKVVVVRCSRPHMSAYHVIIPSWRCSKLDTRYRLIPTEWWHVARLHFRGWSLRNHGRCYASMSLQKYRRKAKPWIKEYVQYCTCYENVIQYVARTIETLLEPNRLDDRRSRVGDK